VWVGVEGSDIVFASLGPRRKLDNIRRDPRVTLSLEGTEISGIGLKEYLVVTAARASTRGEGPSSCSDLAHTYLGPDVKFPPMDDPPPGVVVRIAVERLGGVGLGPDPARRPRLAGRPQPLAGDAQRRAARGRASTAGATSACPVAPELFAETVRALPGAGFAGANVTIPHKEAALAGRRGHRRPRAHRRGQHADLHARRRHRGRQHRRSRGSSRPSATAARAAR
jgi:hypothetical protein